MGALRLLRPDLESLVYSILDGPVMFKCLDLFLLVVLGTSGLTIEQVYLCLFFFVVVESCFVEEVVDLVFLLL